MSNLSLRLISAIILLFIVVVFFLLGPIAVTLLSGIVSFLLYLEMLKGINGKKVNRTMLPIPIIGLIAPFFFNYQLVTIVFLALILFIGFYPRKFRYLRISVCLYIFVAQYLFLIVICELPIGLNIQNPFYLLIIAISSDVGGYFFGNYLGNKKLAPIISPKKTWEGSIGACFLTIIVWFFLFKGFADNLILELIIVVILGICAQVGDLIESYAKRILSIKESGGIIPGHGGIFDRLDSVIGVIFGYSLLSYLGFGF